MEPEQVAAVTAVADRYAAATAQIDARATQSVESIWSGFTGWYTAAAVTAAATQSARVSQGFQQMTAGSAAEYIRVLLAAFPARFGTVGPISLQPVRGGADLPAVYARVAAERRRQFSLTADDELADAAAMQRLTQLMDADQMLARRQVTQDAMVSAKVKFFRRLIHPELSHEGTCGLCAIAATRVYRTVDLMPIHVRCKCEPMPVAPGVDPARVINDADMLDNQNLAEVYAIAGGSSADSLGRVRAKVVQHGEMGPILVDAKHAARDEDTVGEQDSPERAAALLARLRPALTLIESREAAGEDMTGQIVFQRAMIARLEQIVA